MSRQLGAVGAVSRRQPFHPSAAKGWVKASNAGAINDSYNVTSVGDTGTGRMTVTWAVDFFDSDYVVVVTAHSTGARIAVIDDTIPPAAGTTESDIYDDATPAVLADPANYAVAAFGAQ